VACRASVGARARLRYLDEAPQDSLRLGYGAGLQLSGTGDPARPGSRAAKTQPGGLRRSTPGGVVSRGARGADHIRLLEAFPRRELAP
jgi:hypothetical protein